MQQQQSRGIAGIDFVAVLIGAVLGGLVVMAIGIVMAIFKGIVRAAVWVATKLKRKSEENVLATESTVIPAVKEASACSTDVDLTELYSPAFEKRHLDAFSRRVEVKNGYATIWFYPHQGIARRTLTVTNAALAKKIGKRLSLGELETTNSSTGIDAVIQQTMGEINNVLATEKPKAREIPKQNAVLSGGNTPSVPDNVGNSNLQVPAVTRRKPRQKQVAYRGNIVRHGLERVGEGERAYECYCLHIDDANLGSVHRVVGTDLERAIKEAGAKDGDFVEVAQVGEIPTAGGRTKNVFAIQKLAYASA